MKLTYRWRWWAVLVWVVGHGLAFCWVYRGGIQKHPLMLVAGMMIFLSPAELWPALKKCDAEMSGDA